VCIFDLGYLDFLSNPPSYVEVYIIANKQGGIRGQAMDGNDRMSDSVANNTSLSVGGSCTGRARAAKWMQAELVDL
jgi:hypothetical protein